MRVFHIYRAVREGRFLYLLIILLLYLLLTPWIKNRISIAVFYSTSMTLVLTAAFLAVSQTKIENWLGVLLAVPALFSMWMAYHLKTPNWVAASEFLVALFLAYTILLLLKFIIRARDVTENVIFAAISVYLVIGIFWSFLFSLMEFWEPGSFEGFSRTELGYPQSFLYFSFVTLTTLGYGDITPATEKAGSLAITEAIIGQIYMTVLIAWLVGLNVSRRIDAMSKFDDE